MLSMSAIAARQIPDVTACTTRAPRVSASSADDEEEECSICKDELLAKRHVYIHDCGHSFHRTCILDWLRTFSSVAEHSCPLCRASAWRIYAENGRMVNNLPLTYGKDMRCEEFIVAYMFDVVFKRVDGVFNFFRYTWNREYGLLRRQRVRACNEGQGRDYFDDITKELMEINERLMELNKVEWVCQRTYDRLCEKRLEAIQNGNEMPTDDLPLLPRRYGETGFDTLVRIMEDNAASDVKDGTHRAVVSKWARRIAVAEKLAIRRLDVFVDEIDNLADMETMEVEAPPQQLVDMSDVGVGFVVRALPPQPAAASDSSEGAAPPAAAVPAAAPTPAVPSRQSTRKRGAPERYGS